MMNNILDSISKVPQDRLAFITDSRNLRYSEIKQIHDNNLKALSMLSGTCVVINARNSSEFILLLPILDGHVKRIVLVPEDIDNSLLNQFYGETKTDYTVYLEDNQLKFNKVASHPSRENKTYSTEWVIPTSGTTNTPKLVAHTFSSLTRTVVNNIEKGEKFKWGLAFDLYRFSGIQVFLQSIISGSTLIVPGHDNDINQTLNLFVSKGCNALSATPSFWRKLLMSQESSNLDLQRITLGGEIADTNILSALKNKFPNSKIAHIYASTEVGVGFSVKDGLPGFPKSYLELGVGSIKLKIDNSGLLWIQPGTTTQKYITRSEMYDQNGFINSGDLVYEKDNRIYFLGRESGAINVGGNKVQPEEVESTLLSSNRVCAAYVYAKDSPLMGSLVCAEIVIHKNLIDKKIIKKEILNYCRKNLDTYKVPAILKIVDEIKITNSGKLKRKS